MDKTDNSRGSRNEIDLSVEFSREIYQLAISTTEVNLDNPRDEIRKVIWMSKIKEQAQSGDDRTGLDESQLCFISLSAFDSGR